LKPSTATAAPPASASRKAANVCGRTSGVSPNITMIWPAPRSIAARAINTACAVPRRSLWRKICAVGTCRVTSVCTASWSGPITTATWSQPAAPAALKTCAISGRPPISCSTLGRLARMRVPSPAASTMARHFWSSVIRFPVCKSQRWRRPIAEGGRG
jgi:hypothetical protein